MMNFRKDFTMLLPFLLCIAVAAASQHKIKCEKCIKVGEFCHNVTLVLNFTANFRETVVISKLGILRSKNILYYAFEPNITDPEYYKIGYVNLDNPETHGYLVGPKPVTNFRTFAIDQDKNIIYVGGSDAIYMSNDTVNANVFSSVGDTIQNIFFNKHVYFVRYGENKLVKLDGEFRFYEEYNNIKDFVITGPIGRNIIVYMNTTGLYANKMNTNDTVYLSRNNFFRGLTVDEDGVVYAWWIDGLYKVLIENEFEDSRIVRVAHIPAIGAVTFDNVHNYVLFSSEQGLYRLTPTNITLC